MANLVVTLTKALPHPFPAVQPDMSVGSAARTETLAIGSESVAGELTAATGEYMVELVAEADCWYTIGITPTAAIGSGRLLLAGQERRHWIAPGQKVAVIDAEPATEQPTG